MLIPRNADGSIKKWVKGMPLCSCNKGNPPGEHLYRDCEFGGGPPKAKEKAAGESAVAEQADFDGLDFTDPSVRSMITDWMSDAQESMAVEGEGDAPNPLPCVAHKIIQGG